MKIGLTSKGEKIERLNTKIDTVVADGHEFKLHLVKTDEEIKAEIRVLDATIQGIAKRIDNQEFINRGVIVGLVLAVLGGFAKLFGWVS